MSQEIMICEKITQLIKPTMPDDLYKIVFKIGVESNAKSISYNTFFENKKNKDISDNFEVPDEVTDNILVLFEELWYFMQEKHGMWSLCYFYVYQNGDFKIDYIFNPSNCFRSEYSRKYNFIDQ
ncbi:MAG: hypothetical protein DCC88_03260 [Spirobacillus cienkowskii]|uniref:DUF600 family protein n=1 Tax=Spirobacillus cienkowskii TaxID=495820 RepID=A0A369KYK1_9BACT|nr:MAG: hypothetical protein DCC88_03260 [Spirobacillus cienkowskii]